MAGREHIINLYRLASRRAVVIALVAVFLAGAGLVNWRHQAAERNRSAATAVSAPAANAASLISLNGRTFEQGEGTKGAVVGEFEGYFDSKSRTFTLQPRLSRSTGSKDSRLYSRSDPSGEVVGFGRRVVRSAFVNNADISPTVTGEFELTNNSSATLYNTRVVFTGFKITNAGGSDAGNVPGATGFAYFNDGQVAYNGKLSVSREYGDIAAAATATRVWTFAVANQPPSFFFTYKVIADLGVAAESVTPAAVQVNAGTGTSVTITGRGFTGTPTVELLPASGSPIAMTGVTATATSITATVPAGTAAAIYSVRVTNPGGTAGGAGSSTILNRLTVTGVPTITFTGTIPGGAFPTAGAYLVSGSATLSSSTPIPSGTVIYVAGGATISIASGGNINADGGIPGITAVASQIVFTAQRSPGASVPANGAWGGIDATGASTANMNMRNVVIEYGGGTGFAGINISGSGRTLRFTDGILRNSAGSGLRAAGANDILVGFARNRVENNGTAATDAALLVSGNAALGLFDLPATGATIATSVGDASYYYSSANDFSGNQLNAVRIGVTADAASNDFSKSGVLVGQGATPIQIAGDCSNPAIVGSVPPAAPAELTITPGANIQLAADLNLQAGDYATNRVGCIAANGYAGVYLGSQPGAPAANRLITFDKIPGGGNFGAIFFARNAMANCILNYVSVQNGGAASACSLGNAEVISDGANVKVTNSQIGNSASGSGGVLAISGAKLDTRGTTISNTTPIIDTVVGGQLGDGNPGLKVNIITPAVAAADPLGRGIYFVDAASSGNYIRFFNTTRSTVTLGGMKIAAGTIRTVVGGGLDGADNIPGRMADPGIVTGVGVSSNGDIMYYVDSITAAVRAWNASNSVKTIGNTGITSIAPGNVGTLSGTGLGTTINAVAVHPTSGDVYVGDATPGIHKIFKIAAAGGAPTTFAGNGATSARNDPLTNGVPASSVPLLQPRALVFDPAGNLYIADTGHGRIARVDGGGNIFSVYQLDVPPPPGSWNNPFISGLAFFGGKLYAALGNQQTIVAVTNPTSASPSGAVIAGTIDASCDYSSSNCGDGGAIDESGFNLLGSTGTPPLAGIAADSKGVFVMDQGQAFKGRIRYMNLSASATEVAGVAIPANNINTVAGTGLSSPFDGSLASSADLFAPLSAAMDANGNLWVTNSTASRLQFVNCSTAPVTIFNGTPAQQTVEAGTAVSVNKDVGNGPTDGAPVNTASFDTPQGVVATAQGIFIADSKRGPTITTISRRTGLIRFINTSASPVTFYSTGGTGIPITVPPGNIMTIAGGSISSSVVGDGANPTEARFLGPTDLAIHPTTGDLYIADAGEQTGSTAASRVRRINRSTGAVSTILTGGVNDAYTGVSFDSAGRLLVANAGRKTSTTNFGNSQILREKASGQCANNPTGCFDTILSGGTGSLLKNPRDVAEGKDGALYVTNAGPSEPGRSDNKLLKIVVSGTSGTATVFAGSVQGYAGDGGPAIDALLNLEATDFQTSTSGIRFDVRVNISISVAPNGDIIFADSKNNAIRRIR